MSVQAAISKWDLGNKLIRFALLLILSLSVFAPANAQQQSSLLPAIPKATGEPHPEGNEFWRKNHMDLMRHDRDLTMRQGDREIEASLKGCFDCHAATDDAGAIVTYESDQHFCRTCHDYVAVKVDCFACHRSTPVGVDETASHATLLPKRDHLQDTERLVAYLQEVTGTIPAGPVPAAPDTAEVSQ